MRTPPRRPRGRPAYPGLLTPAEQRVLEALRVESTNAGIAARLGIGVETVRYHLENIRGKLGIQDRAELAAWREDEATPRRTRWSLGAALAFFRSGTVVARLSAGLFTSVLVVALVITLGRLRPANDGGGITPSMETSGSNASWAYRRDVGYLHIAGQAVLADGSVLVLGDVQAHSTNGRREPGERDILLVKLGPDGSPLFQATHPSPGSDRANAFAVRVDGGVYIVGGTNGRPGGTKRNGRSDAYLAAFSTGGQLEWIRTFGTPKIDGAQAVSILEDGGAAVFWDTPRAESHITVFDASGHQLATATLPEGVFVTGASPESGGLIMVRGWRTVRERWGWGNHALVGAVGRTGELAWSDELPDSSLQMVAVSNGTTLVAGTHDASGPFREPAGSPNAFVAAYSPAGQQLWRRDLSTTGRDVLWPTTVSDPSGTLFIARLGLETGTRTGAPPYTKPAAAPTLPGLHGSYLIRLGSSGVMAPVEPLARSVNLLGPGGALFDVSLEQQPGFGRRSGGPYTLVISRYR